MIRHDILPTLLLMLSVLLPYRGLAQGVMSLDGEIATCGIDSYKEMKYGQVSPDLHTGSVNVSIPFYTYQDPDFEIPISFGYTSSGHQPNSKAGVMGPDWRLDGCTGCISVEIKGLEDYGADKAGNPGFFVSHLQDYSSFTNPKLWRFCTYGARTASSGAFAPYLLLVPNGSYSTSTGNFDAQSDIYHFSVPGRRGTFHLGWNGKVYVYNTSGPAGNSNQGYSVDIERDGSARSIIIKYRDGYSYTFSTFFDRTTSTEDGSTQRTAWHLSAITAPNGRQVHYYYHEYSTTDCSPKGYDLSGNTFAIDPDGRIEEQPNFSLDHRVSGVNKDCHVPSAIRIDNGPTIRFAYDIIPEAEADQFSTDDPLLSPFFRTSTRLTGIYVIRENSADAGGPDTLRHCCLSYSSPCNGKRLNFLTSIEISGEGTYGFRYHNEPDKDLPGNGTFSIDHWGYFNGRNNTRTSGPFVKITSLDSNQDETIASSGRESNAAYARCGMLDRIDYPSGGYSHFTYEPNTYSYAWKRKSENTFFPAVYQENGTCGGLRIRKIEHFNALDSSLAVNRYEYPQGGILLNLPRYKVHYTAFANNGTAYFEENNIDYCSASINNYNGSHIEYPVVREIYADSSVVEYHFTNSMTEGGQYADYVHTFNVENERTFHNSHSWSMLNTEVRFIASPLVSRNAERGRVLEKLTYKNKTDTLPLFEETTRYNSNTLLSTDAVPTYLIRKTGYTDILTDNYKTISTAYCEYSCPNESEPDGPGNDPVRRFCSTTDLFYNAYGQQDSSLTVESGGRMLAIKKVFSSDSSSVGPLYGLFARRNLLDNVVQEFTWSLDSTGKRSLVTGTKYTYSQYDSLPLPSSKSIYNPLTGLWELSETYVSYNGYGRITQSLDLNGVPTSYVWGYNSIYLVAVIKGVTTAQLVAVIGDQPLSGELSDMQCSAIKNAYPYCSVTKLDYDPFIGVQKIFDPAGEVRNLGYNRSGKPSYEKDISGSKLRKALYSTDNKTADNRQ